jgi:hypothetical protein
VVLEGKDHLCGNQFVIEKAAESLSFIKRRKDLQACYYTKGKGKYKTNTTGNKENSGPRTELVPREEGKKPIEEQSALDYSNTLQFLSFQSCHVKRMRNFLCFPFLLAKDSR